MLVLGVYYKLQTFLYLPANGIVQGMRPLIGYNYGAGEMKRVNRIYSVALSMTLVIMAAGTVLCLGGSGMADRAFHSQPDHHTGRSYGPADHQRGLPGIVGFRYLVRRAGGAGKGSAVPSDFPLRYVIIIIPAAFLLSRVLGAAGRLECVLDYGGSDCRGRICHLQAGR